MASLALMNIRHLIKEPALRLERVQNRLLNFSEGRFTARTTEYRHLLQQLRQNMILTSQTAISDKRQQLELLSGVLSQQSPGNIMEKGWLLAMKGTKLIKSVQDLQPGDRINLQLHDGKADTVVETTRPGAQ